MTVNGRPRWTCRTHISKVVEDGRVEIGPLANLPLIKDLACDMAAFFEKWQKAKGAFVPSKSRQDPIERISPATAPRIAADAAIECINCAVCYSACDTVRWNEDYLGPAALNRAWTLVNDVRDAGAMPATRTRAARSTVRKLSTQPPPLPASSAAPCRPTSGASCDGGRVRQSQALLSLGLAIALGLRLPLWRRFCLRHEEGGGQCVRGLDRPPATVQRGRQPIQVAGRIGWG